MSTYFAYFKIKFLNEIQYKVAAIAGVLTHVECVSLLCLK